MKAEIRATGLRAMRDKRGLTQRQLAKDLGISQNYLPALENGVRTPGPDVRQRLMHYFACQFEDLFKVVLINPENGREQVLQPAASAE